nr:MAG TPA: hypothetical protein [Caudoviricetes sp.]
MITHWQFLLCENPIHALILVRKSVIIQIVEISIVGTY